MTPAQKAEFLDQSRKHFEADALIKGAYGRDDGGFKGCSVGCHLHHIMPGATAEMVVGATYKHRRVAEHYGYPEWLAYLQDTVFEGLPDGDNRRWHVQLAETLADLPDGYDWQKALHRVHLALLRISCQHAGESKTVVESVMDLHRRAAGGEDVSTEQWRAVESAAWSTARSAVSAVSAASSAARGVEEIAVWSAAERAVSAAGAVRRAAYQEIRDGVLAALAAPSASPATLKGE
jgi:hypothetical protein